MDRRSFVGRMAAVVPAVGLGAAWGGRPAGARVTRLSFTPVQGRFHKFVAMNSYDTAPKGHTYENTLVRIATDQGVEGVGVMEYARPDDAFLEAVRALLGADPGEIYTRDGNGRVTGRAPAFEALLTRYPHLDGPLFDLLGKLEERPAWGLLGDPVRDEVEAYDGTLYFSDIWFADRGVRAVVEEAEEAVRKGYPALKLKVGRGWRWMEKDEGLRRDVEVVTAVRSAVGPDVRIQVDANNGWRRDPEDAWRLVEATAGDDVHFLEEPFPEDPAAYGDLKERMAAAGLATLLADGENLTHAAPFRPYLEPRRLVDVLQLDIRRGGFLENLELARMGAVAGAMSVPHNWGSRVGVLMALHFAKAVPNATAAEDDRSTMDVVLAEGYAFRNGRWRVSDAPGLGLRVDEDVWRRKYAGRGTVIGPA